MSFDGGETVTLIDLQRKPHWNGREAVVMRFDDNSGRWIIRLKGCYEINQSAFVKLKAKKLKLKHNADIAPSTFASLWNEMASFTTKEDEMKYGFILQNVLVRLEKVSEQRVFDITFNNSHTDNLKAFRLNSEGQQYLENKEYDRAWDVLHSALELMKSTCPKNHPKIAVTSLLLADTYLKMRQFDNALQYCMDTIRIRDANNDSELMYAVKCLRDILRATERVCAHCNIPCKCVCSACKAHWYCSRKHQKMHWKDHHRVYCKDALYREHAEYSRPRKL